MPKLSSRGRKSCLRPSGGAASSLLSPVPQPAAAPRASSMQPSIQRGLPGGTERGRSHRGWRSRHFQGRHDFRGRGGRCKHGQGCHRRGGARLDRCAGHRTPCGGGDSLRRKVLYDCEDPYRSPEQSGGDHDNPRSPRRLGQRRRRYERGRRHGPQWGAALRNKAGSPRDGESAGWGGPLWVRRRPATHTDARREAENLREFERGGEALRRIAIESAHEPLIKGRRKPRNHRRGHRRRRRAYLDEQIAHAFPFEGENPGDALIGNDAQ